GRVPDHFAVVVDDGLSHDGHFVVAVSIVVEYDVWEPDLFCRDVQLSHTPVLVRIPLQLVVGP
ncbi:hypothetical protein X975_22625, partial [Stegodyphus mimosarum]